MAKLIKQLPQKNPHLNNHQQKNPNQAKPQLLSGNVPLPWWIPQGAEVWNLWKCLFTPLSLNKWDQIGSCWHWLSSFPLQWERLWFLILTSSFFLTLVWFYFWWEVHNDYNEINWWVEVPPNFLIIFFFFAIMHLLCAALGLSGSFGWSCNDEKGKMWWEVGLREGCFCLSCADVTWLGFFVCLSSWLAGFESGWAILAATIPQNIRGKNSAWSTWVWKILYKVGRSWKGALQWDVLEFRVLPDASSAGNYSPFYYQQHLKNILTAPWAVF